MKAYIHQVHYYETDQMGVVHHSNYVRWMEEARVDYLKQIGCGYAESEKRGIISPVLGYSCSIEESTHFDEQIRIAVRLEKYNGVRLFLSYIMTKENGHVAARGTSEHCFINRDGRVLSLRKADPALHERLLQSIETESE